MNAHEILAQTLWFADASESLRDALATVMVRTEVADGHVFVREGGPMDHLIIIEEGALARTKVTAEGELLESVMTADFSSPRALEDSVVVDRVKGKGRITGLLHVSTKEHDLAYASVIADGPATVWLISGEDLREVVSRTPEHALHMIGVMAKSMRMGTKSLRGLMKNIRRKPSDIIGEGGDGPKVCKVLCYDSTSWVRESFTPAVEAFNNIQDGTCSIAMDFTADRLTERTATHAATYDAICLFVNDKADENVLRILSLLGVKMVAMRCAGYDRVDTKAALAYGMTVARVPAYSPYAVAEHAIALLMSVNRKIHIASTRVKMANFTLDTGLLGIDIHGKTVGVMGTGKIGQILCSILAGFGAKIICYDVYESDEVKKVGGVYMSKDEIFAQADIIFLMMPLLPPTRHTINHDVLQKLKRGVIIVNTARGGLIDTKALLSGLQSGVIGGCGLDVYENEAEYFFQDWSARNVEDPDLVSLLGNNKVVLTAHQAFFTKEAIDKIVSTTLENIKDWESGKSGPNHPNTCTPLPK